jgi:hypothetical protein
LHWTRDQVLDQVDMPFLEALHRAWQDHPSLRKLVAVALGHRPKPRKSDLAELLAMFPDGVLR